MLASMVIAKCWGREDEKKMQNPRQELRSGRRVVPSPIEFRKLYEQEILQCIESTSLISTMPRKAPTPLKVKKNIFSDVVSITEPGGATR